MRTQTKTLEEIERAEQIAIDTRKMFIYHGAQGYWSWCDRGDQHTEYGKFDTRLDALLDAVEPYLSNEE